MIAAMLLLVLVRPEAAQPHLIAQDGHQSLAIRRLVTSTSERFATMDVQGTVCVWDALGRQVGRLHPYVSALADTQTPHASRHLADLRRTLCLAIDDSGAYVAVSELLDPSKSQFGFAKWVVSLYEVAALGDHPTPLIRFMRGVRGVGHVELVGKAVGVDGWKNLDVCMFPRPEQGDEVQIGRGSKVVFAGEPITVEALREQNRVVAAAKASGTGEVIWVRQPARGPASFWSFNGSGHQLLGAANLPNSVGPASQTFFRMAASSDGSRVILFNPAAYVVFDLRRASKQVTLVESGTKGAWRLPAEFDIRDAALSPEGKSMAFARYADHLEILEVGTKKSVVAIPESDKLEMLLQVAWQPIGDGSLLTATIGQADQRANVRRWWLDDAGRPISAGKKTGRLTAIPKAVKASPDGLMIAVGSDEAPLQCFDLRIGRPVPLVPASRPATDGDGKSMEKLSKANSIEFAPNGAQLAFGHQSSSHKYDMNTASELRRLSGSRQGYEPAGFVSSRDCVWVQEDRKEKRTVLIERSGKPDRVLRDLVDLKAVRATPEAGVRMLYAGPSLEGMEVRTVSSAGDPLQARRLSSENPAWDLVHRRHLGGKFSEDGRILLTLHELERPMKGSPEPHLQAGYAAWNVETGMLLSAGYFSVTDSILTDVAAIDAAGFVIGHTDGSMTCHGLGQLATSRPIRIMGARGRLTAIEFLRVAEARHPTLAVGSEDGSIRFWSRAALDSALKSGGSPGTPDEIPSLVTLVLFEGGKWAVTDESQRFDATRAGDVDGIHWIVQGRAIRLDEFDDRQYAPTLLADALSGSTSTPQEVGLHGPSVLDRGAIEDTSNLASAYCEVDARRNVLVARIPKEDMDKSIPLARVFVNGIPRFELSPSQIDELRRGALEISLDTLKEAFGPEGTGKVEIKIESTTGTSRSRGVSGAAPSKGERPEPNPRVYGLAVGCSTYPGRPLTCSANDARAVASLVQGLKRPGDVDVLIEDEKSLEKVTAAAIKTGLGRLTAKVSASEGPTVALIYLSGHGSYSGGYRFDLPNGESVSWRSIEQEVAALGKLKVAPQVVIILDTCSSGGVAADFVRQFLVDIKPYEDAAKRAGFCLLAATKSGEDAGYELPSLGFSVMSYSLLDSIQYRAATGPSLADGRRLVDLSDCFAQTLSASSTRFSRTVDALSGRLQSAHPIHSDDRPIELGSAPAELIAKVLQASTAVTVYEPEFRRQSGAVEGDWVGEVRGVLRNAALRVGNPSAAQGSGPRFVCVPRETPVRPGCFLRVTFDGETDSQRIKSLDVVKIELQNGRLVEAAQEVPSGPLALIPTKPTDLEILLNWFRETGLPAAAKPSPPRSQFEAAFDRSPAPGPYSSRWR